MNTIDIIISVLLLFGLVRGFIKGFFIEIASLVALVGGLYGAMHFSFYASDILKTYVSWDEKYIQIAAFSLTFLGIIILVSLLGKILTKLMESIALGLVNKIFGAVFGFLKIALILSFILLFFNKINSTIPFVEKETLEKSILFKPVKEFVPLLFPDFLKKEIGQE
ncbi:MAG: CvpA family protein [Flavobacteriaceae bacterium]|nr:CvpA family protein [Flavobacteriaceae bacterium]